MISEQARDDLAEVVIERFRQAKEYRSSIIIHQGKTAEALMNRAFKQYRREYTQSDARDLHDAFGFTPTRYFGVTQQKVNASVAWQMDLVINNLDTMFTVSPTPNPTLDDASVNRIRDGIRHELVARMQEVGIADPELLTKANGDAADEVKAFLQEQALALKKVEQARIVSLATQRAGIMQTAMRDTMVEGHFRQAYSQYTFDRNLYGVGYMKFPDWQRIPALEHTKSGGVKRVWKTVPLFRHVPVHDFYPIDDGPDLMSNTGNTERTEVTKVELIKKLGQDAYFKSEIEAILDEYEFQPRNWVDAHDDNPERARRGWGLDETIPLLIHEGYFSGAELANYGITGVDPLEYVSAHIEVCGWRTIKAEIIEMPGNAERSYFGAPYLKAGTGLYDYIGLAAMLWDTEQRVNRFMHLVENNADWASRPPIMKNKQSLSNPNDADFIAPGGQYDVEEHFGVTGTMPDALRPMQTVSAQYHLLMTQVTALLRQADEDCGIPAFAYSSQDFGRASLGEYSQRMSNALRTIKMSALNEDIHFIEPTFDNLFAYKMENDKELSEGQDIDCLIRGMTGLLKEDLAQQKQEEVIPMILGAEEGVVPQSVKDYAIRELLQNAGFPIDALGVSDPQVDQALAVAARQPSVSVTPGGPQVPQLDGRSAGVNPDAVSQTNGISNFSMPQPGGIE